jgi:ubiquinone/menaquinone biosynthesis C-methylase UbiE
MFQDDSHKAEIYSKLGIRNTGYLGFRDIPRLIQQYAHGKKTLDYGCGAGRSSSFLRELGLEVEGMDISSAMIAQARLNDKLGHYTKIYSAAIPRESNSYDIVFSSLVLFEISLKTELTLVFKEVYRVLKKDAIFIILTGSSDMYSHPWLTLNADYEQNTNLKSGSIAKVRLEEIDLEFEDYFWTDEDYESIIKTTHFTLLERLKPLGTPFDGYPWRSETRVSPYVIYVLKK